MKRREKEKAKRLRRQGHSLSEIVKKVSASKTAISYWIRDIELTKAQIKRLKNKGKSFGNTYTSDFYRNKRKLYQKEGVSLLEKYGADFLCGCVLYWGEGTKSHQIASVINSDPNIIKYFLCFLRKYFFVSDSKIRIHCTYYDGANVQDIETYWRDFLGLPKSCFTKSTKVKSMRKTT